MGERKRVNRDFKERKQKLRKEGKRQRVSWNSVRAEKLTWHALEKLKKYLSASGFNLYYRL